MQEKQQHASSEFVLTRAVKLLHIISLRLHNLEYCEKTYHQFYFC